MTATAAQLTALKSLVKMTAIAVSDTMKAIGETDSSKKLADFTNIIPQAIVLLGQVGNLSFQYIGPADYSALIEEAAEDLVLPASKTAAIVNATLNALPGMINAIAGIVNAINAAAVTPIAPVVAK